MPHMPLTPFVPTAQAWGVLSTSCTRGCEQQRVMQDKLSFSEYRISKSYLFGALK